MLCKIEALQNFTSFTRKYLWLSPFLSKTVSIHALSPQTYNCIQRTPSPLVFCEYIYVKIFFHCFIWRKYPFRDVLQNRCSWKFRKIHRKLSLPDSLDSNTNIFLSIFLKVLGTTFLRNTSERLLLISIPSFYCFKTFLFQNRYLFNIPSYFGGFQNL